MVLKKLVNADAGDADHWGGNDQDSLTTAIDLGESYKYLVVKSGSTYYVKGSAGETVHSGSTPATEIQYALDNLTVGRTHKEIVAIRGNITLTGLTIPSYTVLDLRGALLKQTDATNTNFLINNDTSGGNTQIEIFGGTIDGNKTGQTEDSIPYNTRNAINFTKVTNGAVHNTTIQNSNSTGFYGHDCTNVSVNNNTILNGAKSGIYFTSTTLGSGKYLYARDNYIAGQDENPIAAAGPTDVWIEGNVCNGNTITSGINCQGGRFHINRNYLTNIQTIGLSMAVEGTYTADESEVCFNHLDSCCVGGGLYGISIDAAYVSDRLIVMGNKCKGPASGSDNSARGLRVSATENSIVSNNICWNWNSCGMFITGATTVTGDGRTFEVKKTIISNNICFDNGKYTTDTNSYNRAGITIRQGTYTPNIMKGINVHDNICYDTGVATQRYGLHFDGTDDIWVHDNDFRDNVLGGIWDGGNNF